ncbi:hypothetical protein ACKWTF_012150 [Chironomus riparius]
MNRDVEASKLFLESERESNRQATTRSSGEAGRSTSPVQDLIKCFCGICDTWFKRQIIEFALKSNGEAILRDDDSRLLLKKFMIYRKNNSNFKTQLEEIVECFELAQDVLNGEKDLEENRADLDDACYTEYWEDYLTRAIDDGTTDDFFHDLIRESSIRLENSAEYSIFKDELKKKLSLKQ